MSISPYNYTSCNVHGPAKSRTCVYKLFNKSVYLFIIGTWKKVKYSKRVIWVPRSSAPPQGGSELKS